MAWNSASVKWEYRQPIALGQQAAVGQFGERAEFVERDERQRAYRRHGYPVPAGVFGFAGRVEVLARRVELGRVGLRSSRSCRRRRRRAAWHSSGSRSPFAALHLADVVARLVAADPVPALTVGVHQVVVREHVGFGLQQPLRHTVKLRDGPFRQREYRAVAASAHGEVVVPRARRARRVGGRDGLRRRAADPCRVARGGGPRRLRLRPGRPDRADDRVRGVPGAAYGWDVPPARIFPVADVLTGIAGALDVFAPRLAASSCRHPRTRPSSRSSPSAGGSSSRCRWSKTAAGRRWISPRSTPRSESTRRRCCCATRTTRPAGSSTEPSSTRWPRSSTGKARG